MTYKIGRWTLYTGKDAKYGLNYLVDPSGATGGPLYYYCEPEKAYLRDAMGKQVLGYDGVRTIPPFVYKKLLSLFSRGKLATIEED